MTKEKKGPKTLRIGQEVTARWGAEWRPAVIVAKNKRDPLGMGQHGYHVSFETGEEAFRQRQNIRLRRGSRSE